ncbi:hypothetical protein CAEBREN_24490 [Caenorhabditis brenneri]|uniref:Uncharacterized protein n=1 Tax=Caenorhabditis brenneri TaxID=135651 RepID=G0MMT9_CAEBE|nr:hypothetical protein CAEBREN_24490 [Caenorhabditis brenneri]
MSHIGQTDSIELIFYMTSNSVVLEFEVDAMTAIVVQHGVVVMVDRPGGFRETTLKSPIKHNLPMSSWKKMGTQGFYWIGNAEASFLWLTSQSYYVKRKTQLESWE